MASVNTSLPNAVRKESSGLTAIFGGSFVAAMTWGMPDPFAPVHHMLVT